MLNGVFEQFQNRDIQGDGYSFREIICNYTDEVIEAMEVIDGEVPYIDYKGFSDMLSEYLYDFIGDLENIDSNLLITGYVKWVYCCYGTFDSCIELLKKGHAKEGDYDVFFENYGEAHDLSSEEVKELYYP
jgi:hypothetical protein